MSFRPQIFRNTNRRGVFAKGNNAVGIDHRSGFKVLLKDLKYEPGTSYLVTDGESDGEHNLVSDSLNFSPQKKVERIGLRWSFPDVALSIGTIVSADHLYIPSYISVSGHFLQHTSVATGVSTNTLDFSQPSNSQYYLVVFPGI